MRNERKYNQRKPGKKREKFAIFFFQSLFLFSYMKNVDFLKTKETKTIFPRNFHSLCEMGGKIYKHIFPYQPPRRVLGIQLMAGINVKYVDFNAGRFFSSIDSGNIGNIMSSSNLLISELGTNNFIYCSPVSSCI